MGIGADSPVFRAYFWPHVHILGTILGTRIEPDFAMCKVIALLAVHVSVKTCKHFLRYQQGSAEIKVLAFPG